MAILGIDVSVYQGQIDWSRVKNESKVKFAILRAGFGRNNVDKTVMYNATECNRLGIPIGLYWFSYALNEDMARAEADYCVEVAKKFNISLPIYFDLEYDSVDYGAKNGIKIDKSLASKFARAFLEEVSSKGYKPGLYTNMDYFNRMFEPDLISKYDIWWATYSSRMQAKAQGIAKIWQYSSTGSVPGIDGNVDMNWDYHYFDENGTEPAPILSKPIMNVSAPNPVVSSVYKIDGFKMNGIDLTPVFDPEYYAQKNPDVNDYANGDKDKLFMHFVYFGMKEQRLAHPDFNIHAYKRYQDLTVAFGEDIMSYYIHYCKFGKKEGRIAINIFATTD